MGKIQFIRAFFFAALLIFMSSTLVLGKSQKAGDIKVSARSFDLFGCIQTDLDVPVLITNNSDAKITSLPMMKIYLNDTVRQRFSLSLDPGDSVELIFDDPFIEDNVGTYVVRVRLDSMDGNSSNNQVALIYHLDDAPESKFSFSNICAGDTSNFANLTSLTQNDTVEFKWLFGDGDTSTNYNVKHLYQPTDPNMDQVYNVSLIAIVGGCEDTSTRGVNVYGIPSAQFGYRVERLNLQILTVEHDDTTSNYYWDFGDGTVSNERKPKHGYEKDQVYDLCLTVTTSNGCVGQHCETFSLGDVGIDKVTENTRIWIQPNPASGKFSLDRLPADINRQELEVQIISLSGEVIQSYSGFQKKYDVKDIASGLYLVSVRSKQFIQTQKIQIQ